MSTYGVIFDMDGVLVDSYAAHLKSWRALAREVGVEITELQFAATFGRTSRAIIRELFGVEDAETISQYDDRKEALYRELIRSRVPEMPGARALVASLHEAGFRIAVGSSGPPENVDLVCGELGIDSMLAARVTGADVSRGKPDPEVFLLAAERMGLPPGRCLVVEDAPAGVEAAYRGGMAVIALAGSHEDQALESADCVVQQLDEIDGVLVRRLTLPARP